MIKGLITRNIKLQTSIVRISARAELALIALNILLWTGIEALFIITGASFDLNDIAEPIGFGGVFGNIETFVGGCPGIAAILEVDAVAFHIAGAFVVRVAARIVAVEILLAGEIRTPWRTAIGAVVPGP